MFPSITIINILVIILVLYLLLNNIIFANYNKNSFLGAIFKFLKNNFRINKIFDSKKERNSSDINNLSGLKDISKRLTEIEREYVNQNQLNREIENLKKLIRSDEGSKIGGKTQQHDSSYPSRTQIHGTSSTKNERMKYFSGNILIYTGRPNRSYFDKVYKEFSPQKTYFVIVVPDKNRPNRGLYTIANEYETKKHLFLFSDSLIDACDLQGKGNPPYNASITPGVVEKDGNYWKIVEKIKVEW